MISPELVFDAVAAQGSSLLQKLEQDRDAGFCYGVLPLAPTVMPLGFILQGSAAVCVT